MPNNPRTPSYRLHKPSGRAVVTLDGRDYYLGTHGTQTSRGEYDRLIAEWLANGRRLPAAAEPDEFNINQLLVAYWRHAELYYRKNGQPTTEVISIRESLRPLKDLYGSLQAREFGPLALKVCRQVMVEAGLSRGVVNSRVGRIKRMFKWAVENELVPASVHHGLQAVSGLKRGRCEARETEPIRPVPDEHVDAIQPPVSRQVWGMVELQRLTGMRGGEVTIMRGCDLNTEGRLWLYRPASHKTEHHGHERLVELGPRAQALLRPFLRPDLEAFLFSPADAESERNAVRRRRRRSPMTPSQAKRTPKANRMRPPRERFDKNSYRRAIARACEKAGVPKWHPHQLRHTYATRIRKEYGLEAARVLLGHRSAAVTETYAELDRKLAARIAAEVG